MIKKLLTGVVALATVPLWAPVLVFVFATYAVGTCVLTVWEELRK